MKLADLLSEHKASVAAMEEQLKVYQKALSDEKKKINDILSQNSDLIEPGFISWYYWETDYPMKPLADAMGLSAIKLSMMVQKPRIIQYECPCCSKSTTKECNSREEHSSLLELISSSNSKKSPVTILCPSCSYVASRLNKHDFASQNDILKVVKYQTMPYKEYLNTDYWKKFAASMKAKVNYKCQLCNGTYDLNVHHKDYHSRGIEKPQDVIVLCRNCHGKFHDKLGENAVPLRDKVAKVLNNNNFDYFRR
jgi:5-methylcytosine-specific restriction endonuclease McrA